MSEVKQNTKSVASLDLVTASDSLWIASLKRLSRNRAAMLGLVIIFLSILAAVFADQLSPPSKCRRLPVWSCQTLTDKNAAPEWVISFFPTMKAKGTPEGYVTVSGDYPIGADALGRDMLSRILYGARISLMVAFVGPTVALLVGVTLGLISGYVGGWVDNLIMRITDIMYAFPTLLLIILLMAFFRPSTGNLEPGTLAATMQELDAGTGGMLFIFIGIGVTSWMQMARLTRGQVLAVREQEYVQAARAIGAPVPQIMWRHIVRNILGPIIVAETLTIPSYISYEAFLSFIGLGVNPPTPSWGAMISDGAAAIRSYPHQALFPALALFLIMFAFNFLGDGLRDALDPRLQGVD